MNTRVRCLQIVLFNKCLSLRGWLRSDPRAAKFAANSSVDQVNVHPNKQIATSLCLS